MLFGVDIRYAIGAALDQEPASTDSQLWTDQEFETKVGNLLRAGVLTSACVVAIGGFAYLVQHGHERPHYGKFTGEPSELRNVSLIFLDAIRGNSHGIIQLGILLLIATPVARVLLAAYAFLRQRDRL